MGRMGWEKDKKEVIILSEYDLSMGCQQTT